MRKTCGQTITQGVCGLWEKPALFTQRVCKFYIMGINSVFVSRLYKFVQQPFAQDFSVYQSGKWAVIPTIHMTNNVYNKGI